MPPTVINWHLTEACNYSCKYCYAAWNSPANEKVLVRGPVRARNLLQQLWEHFSHTSYGQAVEKPAAEASRPRLNIAGGEPMLYRNHLQQVIKDARNIGFDVSIITNGSLLTPEFSDQFALDLSWLGISIDSACAQKNIAIGRLDTRQRQLNLHDLASIVEQARSKNPRLQIKVNTVVNAINWNDDLSIPLSLLRPERWKVLRVLPVMGNQLAIDDEQFEYFVNNHRAFSSIACVEDNIDMKDSYIMIDPHGRFFQNTHACHDTGYVYSRPILDVGVKAAFSDITFNAKRFQSRYLVADDVTTS